MNRFLRALPFPMIMLSLFLCQSDEIPDDFGTTGLKGIVKDRIDQRQFDRGVRFGMAQKRMSRLKQSNSDDRRP